MKLILGLFVSFGNLLWQGHTGSRGRQPVPPAEELLDEEDDELARFRK